MPEVRASALVLSPSIDQWLSPLDGEQPCGPDLEYDPESLELAQAAAGKPESQFAAGEPPDWARVRGLAESLLARTRDLRVALWWGRASVNLDGFGALPSALALLHGLLDRFWEELHPLPEADEPDALARLSVIGSLDKLEGLLGDIRQSRLSTDGRIKELRVRDVELALSKLTPRADETTRSQAEIAGMLAGAADVAAALNAQTQAALDSLGRIDTLMSQRYSMDLVVDLARLRGMLACIKSVLPVDVDPAADVAGGEGKASASDVVAGLAANDDARMRVPVRRAVGVHSVDTRQDAIRAIELVCAYLERSEPTNPAQLLLRRAARVIDKNFLQLVHELAPDSVKEVARIMGVDPSSVKGEN